MKVPLDPQAISCSSAIDDAHLLGGVARLAAVLARLQLADLPGPVHLVAEAPVADVVRLLVAVRRAAARSTACRDRGCSTRRRRPPSPTVPVPKFMPSSGSAPTSAAPVDELVGAELIRLERVPRAIEHRRPLRLRADAVEPVVAGDEVAARIADDRHAELLHLARDVGAESFGIGEARAGLVDAGVDRAAQVLEKRPQHPAVEVGAPRRRLQERARGAAAGLRVADGIQPRRSGEQRAGLSEGRKETASIGWAHIVNKRITPEARAGITIRQ